MTGAELWNIVSWLLQSATAGGLAVLAFLGLAPTKLGERFLNHHLERKLAALKHEQNEKIEALKAELQHLADRGKRSNEREFAALSAIWDKFVDAYLATQRAVHDFMQFPDLNKLPEDDVAAFLQSTDLKDDQKKGVESATDKVKAYVRYVNLNTINEAGREIYELRQLIRKNGAYIPDELTEKFNTAAEALSLAHIERSRNFTDQRYHLYEGSLYLIKDGEAKVFKVVEAAVKARVFRA
jgi:hypothetical protein